MNDGDIVMLENTRFEDVVDGEVVKNESKNNEELGKY
jgi:phosphoglycerate kinase